jgi:nucleosome binding factor SPN SPT16 subunit
VLTETVIECLSEGNYKLEEMMATMGQVSKTKIGCEIENMTISAKFAEWTMNKLIVDVEENIDRGISIKHSKLAGIIERMVDNPDKVRDFNKKYGFSLDPEGQLLDFPLGVLVQSGKDFQLNKYSIESNDLPLDGDGDAIYLNILSKYADMHSMACRTMLINPTDA